MIVDDEYPVKIILRDIIMNAGLQYQITAEAENGAEALLLASQIRPNLIITDIMMPVMDGLELIRNLRSRDIESEIIIVSGYNDFGYAQQAIQYGVSRYLLKPLDDRQVISYLQELQHSLQLEAQLTSGMSQWVWFCKTNGERLAEQLWALNDQEVARTLSAVQAAFAQGQLSLTLIHQCYSNLLQIVLGEISSRSDKALEASRLSLPPLNQAQPDAAAATIFMRLLEKLRQTRQHGHRRKVQEALDLVRQSYSDVELSLPYVAERVQLSASRLSGLLKEETGRSFTQLLTEIRMEQAMLLLNNASAKTYEVALEVGYSDYSYFTKAFKKYCGLTPMDYRKRMGVF
jgi:two-component system response regulator YesN